MTKRPEPIVTCLRCRRPALMRGELLHPDKCHCVHPLPGENGRPLPGGRTVAEEYRAIVQLTVRETGGGR